MEFSNRHVFQENHGTILQLDDALKKMKVCWMSLDCRSLLEMVIL